jgi:RNA polymerase sigma-70 factor (ECF subfamily)
MSRRDDDRNLVRRLLAGDEAAFDEFAEHQVPALYRFARGRLRGDRELTQEIVQSTLCKALAGLSAFRGEAALLTWLCACCRNEIAAHFRRHRWLCREVDFDATEEVAPDALQVDRPAGPERQLIRREAASLVHEALDALPPHYGRALEWKYIEGLSVREIAGRLELGLKAAESVLSRARRSFKTEYGRLTAGPGSGAEPHREAVI